MGNAGVRYAGAACTGVGDCRVGDELNLSMPDLEIRLPSYASRSAVRAQLPDFSDIGDDYIADSHDVEDMALDRSEHYAALNAGLAPLMLASGAGEAHVVPLLLEGKADIEASDSFGRTALMFAAEVGHVGIVELLCENGANLEATPSIGQRRSVLHQAITAGNVEIVKVLMRASADIMARTVSGETPLHIAASLNRPEICKLLLSALADVDALNGVDASTALIAGARTGALESVVVLLDAQADTDAANILGHTALMVAAMENSLEVVSALVDYQVSPEEEDLEGLTALYHACKRKHFGIAQKLVRSGANRLACDIDGVTAASLMQGHYKSQQKVDGPCRQSSWYPLADCKGQIDFWNAEAEVNIPLVTSGPRMFVKKHEGSVRD